MSRGTYRWWAPVGAQFGLELVDLRLKLVDEAQARSERPGPGLRDWQGGEQLAPAPPEQV
jgi:hypothetical protein